MIEAIIIAGAGFGHTTAKTIEVKVVNFLLALSVSMVYYSLNELSCLL